jgi:hypothetical protein
MKQRTRLSLICGSLVALLLAMLPVFISPFAHDPVAHAATGFVARCGIHFCLDGHPYYFAGADAYDMFTFGDGSSTSTPDAIENSFMDKAQIDATMQNMENDKVMVLRTWMFDHEQWHGFETAKGVYNDAQFDEFDYIINSAKAHNIKLIPTFENYWEAYGGIDTRLQWEGLPTGEANRWRFFNQQQCPGCFTQYKNYVSHALNHVNHYTGVAYKDDPTIFSWELMNEPRYEGATPNEDTTGTTLRAWVDTMGAYVKSIDANHMLDAGLEGQQTSYGYGGNSGNPFVYIQQSPYIDFTSAHPYPTASWANLTQAQTKTLIDQWVSDSHNVVGKPFVMGEYNVETSFDRTSWWQAMLGEIEAVGGDGDAFWNYVARNVGGTLDVAPGDPALTVFHQHSLNMQAKNGGTVATPTVAPTTRPTGTPTAMPTVRPTITPTPRPTIVPTVTPTPVPGVACQIHYAVQSQWPGGFTGNITITNKGTATINNWTITFSFGAGQQLQQGWSAVYTQQGAVMTVSNPSYNTSIAANQAVTSGFNASWTGSNPIPTSFKLNGTTCSAV